MNTRMETYTGKLVDLSRPDPATICIEDIAWHLSRIARYGGATRSERVYCVGQHSVIVMNRVKQLTATMPPNPMRLAKSLLHDGHEAYTGDPIAPMSELLDLRVPMLRLKERVQQAIYESLFKGLDFDTSDDPIIHEADLWARTYEAYHLMHSRGKDWFPQAQLDEEYMVRNFIVWSPGYAYDSFKNHFTDLLKELRK